MLLETEHVLLETKHVQLAHADQRIVRDFSFQLARGEILCLMGPSGCGKTTLLRAIAGLHPLQSGEIFLRGEKIASTTLRANLQKLKIGFVFQDLALFPHLSVADNIGLGLQQIPLPDRKARISELLGAFELSPFAKHYPHQLSGGQQQRVAIARAMAPKYDLVLLDEPFSSLDAKLRVELSRQLRQQLKALDAAAIMVSHDQEEGLVCADRVAIMSKGELKQLGTPFEVYCQPADAFVASFVGESAWIPGVLDNDVVHSVMGSLSNFQLIGEPAIRTGPVNVFLRPEDLRLSNSTTDNPLGGSRGVMARVLHSEFRGAYTCYRLEILPQLAGSAVDTVSTSRQLLLSAPHARPLPDGSEVRVELIKDRALVFLNH